MWTLEQPLKEKIKQSSIVNKLTKERNWIIQHAQLKQNKAKKKKKDTNKKQIWEIFKQYNDRYIPISINSYITYKWPVKKQFKTWIESKTQLSIVHKKPTLNMKTAILKLKWMENNISCKIQTKENRVGSINIWQSRLQNKQFYQG